MAHCDNRFAVGVSPKDLLGRPLSVLAVFFFFLVGLTNAASYADAENHFFKGEFKRCAAIAKAEVERGVWNEKWPVLLLRCYLETGQYQLAEQTYETAKTRFKNSIALRYVGHDVYNYSGKSELAGQQYAEIVALVQRTPWRFSSSSDRVVLGRFLLANGDDAREVLELAYDRARRSNPKLADIYIATAELALQKHDYKEAANSLKTAVELQPENPYIHYLTARAWASSDPEKTNAGIEKAIELNPDHVPSLLFQADHLIDGEKYDEATKLLNKALKVNGKHPEAWAYKSVIAHLRADEAKEEQTRKKALASWKTNPNVDHLIGRKLSRNYRFAEGAAAQRRALEFEPNMLAAKLQLSQDLLRLGDEAEGWRLAAEVHDQDGYNVVAYNAVTLRDAMRNFATIETDRFILRMDDRESRIYGQQVLVLLNEAWEFFCEKYEVEIGGPVTVEIFPEQKDFAIRTFGLPGGAGFLGVCFGRVVTANSPSSQGDRPANWQSVLWHEFCHVVTLEKTRNKMPRWVSEGISTYEEQEKNPAWGERLTTAYRQMIASDDELTPVSQLSAAFLSPKSPQHLQFAYFESSLVIRYIIEKHGLQTLRRILVDLGVGMPINEALERYVGSLEALDKDFAKYARAFVAKIAPEVDWELSKEVAEMSLAETRRYLKQHPANYQATIQFAQQSIKAEDFEAAEEELLELQKLHPEDRELGGVLGLLANIYRKQEDVEKESDVLSQLVRLNDRALEAYARLAEIHEENGQWEGVRENALRFLSVQPMLPFAHEQLANAAEELDRPDELASSLTALLEMEPVDPAAVHYRIARAHRQTEKLADSKRQVLKALEYAPRYRNAQRLLLELVAVDQEAEASPSEFPNSADEVSDAKAEVTVEAEVDF